MSDLEQTENNIEKAMAGMIEAFDDIEPDTFFYLCGVRPVKEGDDKINPGDGLKLDFWFPYNDVELKSATMEEIQWNSATDDERKEMRLTNKQKFAQGFLLATYRNRMDSISIHVVKSKQERNMGDLQKYFNELSSDDLEACKVSLTDGKTSTNN